MNPPPLFFYAFYASMVADGSMNGATEVMATVAGGAVILFGLYKLGTVETIIKLVSAVFLAVAGLYGVGYFYPPFQEAAWYQLLKYIVEVGPRFVLEQLGGTTS